MALNINPIHIQHAHIDLVSVRDDAINWEESLPEVNQIEVDGEMLTGVEAKKHAYGEEYDVTKLVYLPSKLPTIFKFKNPRLLANKERIDTVRTQSIVSFNPKKEASPGALNRAIWAVAFVSYREGDGNADSYTVTNGNIAPEYLQGFSDAGVLAEFANAISIIMSPKKTA